jgi:copper chaperone CopZ
LERLEGVEKARVSFAKGKAYVSYDPDRVTIEKMFEAINRLGFRASKRTGSQKDASKN